MRFLRLTGDVPVDVAALRRWLAEPDPPRLLVETSGSTGAPKRVVLSRDAVVASATATAARIGSGRWWLTLPTSYVAGLQVVVRSLLAGHEPSLAAADARFAALVPTQLHRLLDSPHDLAALRRMDAVLLGGGPVDPDLWARAEAGGVRLVATYGASETAGGCVYDGVPLDGVEVRLGADGRVALRGPMLFDGYDGDPALTAATLVDGWFVTSDLGELVDGRLRILGRVDDVVISGGVNVPTPAVAARLREHPAVRDAAVVGVPDPEWGQRVVAVLVGDLSLADVRDWVTGTLPRAWAPREVRTVDALPLLPNGKVDRAALR